MRSLLAIALAPLALLAYGLIVLCDILCGLVDCLRARKL